MSDLCGDQAMQRHGSHRLCPHSRCRTGNGSQEHPLKTEMTGVDPMKEPKALQIGHDRIKKVVAESGIDGFVKILRCCNVFRSLFEDEDLSHDQALPRRFLTSVSDRKTPFPSSTFLRRASRTSRCHAGEETWESVLETDVQSNSMACRRSATVMLSMSAMPML